MNRHDDAFIKDVAVSTHELGFELRGTVGAPEAWTKTGAQYGAYQDVASLGRDMMKVAIERNDEAVIHRLSDAFDLAHAQDEPWAVKHAIASNSAGGLNALMESLQTMDGHHSIDFHHLTSSKVYDGLTPELRAVADRHETFDNQFIEQRQEVMGRLERETDRAEIALARKESGESGFTPKASREFLDPPSMATPVTKSTTDGLSVKPQKRGMAL